ncbi:DUF3566 domain-containing protein [Antribacter gilvus]|uniref:DUF3566 domain-containing protein n=1 Tax=Antribacter gilvus TaxID=2304675 RepID=UPI001F0CD17D|nr:DUF3566 domain-containing protein [Antribacter gilvus]
MTSDKTGPTTSTTAKPELDEDLDITRVRVDPQRPATPAKADTTSEKTPFSGEVDGESKNQEPTNGSSGSANGKPADAAKPVPVKPAPPSPAPSSAPASPSPALASGSASGSDASSTADSIPVQGGIWRSAYEAGATPPKPRTGSTPVATPVPAASRPVPPPPGAPEKSQPSGAGALGAVPAPSDPWNRPGQPEPSNGVPVPADDAAASPIGDAAASMKAGAVKAAAAALAAARSAAKRVSSVLPEQSDESSRSESRPATTGPRPDMHYTAAGVRGTATPDPAAATVPPGTPPVAHGAGGAGPQVRPQSGAMPQVAAPAPAGPRRVRLAVSRVDPWSVMKLAFLLSVAVAIMTVVATAVFWSVLNSLEVFTTIEKFAGEVVGTQSNVDLMQYVEFDRVVSLATLIAICNIVLMTGIATIMAFLYNIVAALVGGVHMTLTDD